MTEGKVSRQTVRNSILKIKVPEKEPKEMKKEVRELHIFADEDHAHIQKPGKAKGKKNQIVPVVTVTEGIVAISTNRNATVNAMHFVDKEFDAKRLWESVDGYISVVSYLLAALALLSYFIAYSTTFWRNLISSVILIFIGSLSLIFWFVVKLILPDGFLFF